MNNLNNADLQKFLFIDKDTNYIVYPRSATFDNNGSFETILGYTNNSAIKEYSISELKVLSEFIYVPNVGRIYAGDKIKLMEDSTDEYTLNYGWYITNEGLDLYGWYLSSPDSIKPFYRSYINTLKVVKFSFNK